MRLSPDELIFWQYGFIKAQRHDCVHLGTDARNGSRLKNYYKQTFHWSGIVPAGKTFWKLLSQTILNQIEDVGLSQPQKYLGFLGTLFLFIAMASLCIIIPGYEPPTGSLSTTAALALCVFVAVPIFGIEEQGIGELPQDHTLSRHLSCCRLISSAKSPARWLWQFVLFGNMMSGSMIIAILLTITPFIFPIFMTALGLLTGMVQAYIFSILATVYIAAATRTHKTKA